MALFQRRHHEAIAAVLRDATQYGQVLEEYLEGDVRSTVFNHGKVTAIDRVITRLIEMFQADNSHFKPDQFRQATEAPDVSSKAAR
jgi:hypothetical protein